MVVSREQCAARDATDPLAPWRARFRLPDAVVYLDGNSLGALPVATAARVAAAVEEEWGSGLVRSWNGAGWYLAPRRVGDKIARLIGARPGEVVVTDSTSVNLHKLLSAAVMAAPGRSVIVSQQDNFPSDLYIASGVGGAELRAVSAEHIEAALDESVAVLLLTHVNYLSGAVHDMARLTEAAHDAGALVLWDLAHSAGALEVDLGGCGVDLAVGCGYKYLNGGPGAPAFLYVAERLHDRLVQPLTGWFGHADPFAFEPGYRRAPGIAHFLTGTPPVLSLVALESGVDLWLEVGGVGAARTKSLELSELFIRLVAERCDGLGLELLSPRDPLRRGSQVSYRHPEALAVMRALIAAGVIGDVRAPDVLRFGIAPLYVRSVDVWDAVETLRAILATEAWRHHAGVAREPVT